MHGGLAVVAVLSSAVVLASILPEGPVTWLLSLPPARWLGRIAIALYLSTGRSSCGSARPAPSMSIVPLTAAALRGRPGGRHAAAAGRRSAAAPRARRQRRAGHRQPGAHLDGCGRRRGRRRPGDRHVGHRARQPCRPGRHRGGHRHHRAGGRGADRRLLRRRARRPRSRPRPRPTPPPQGTFTRGPGRDLDRLRHRPRRHPGRARAGPRRCPTQCTDWEATWTAQIAATDPDVVVLATGLTEVADHQFDPGGPWVAPGERGLRLQAVPADDQGGRGPGVPGRQGDLARHAAF